MVKGKIHQGVKNRLKMALDLKLVFRYALDKDLNKAQHGKNQKIFNFMKQNFEILIIGQGHQKQVVISRIKTGLVKVANSLEDLYFKSYIKSAPENEKKILFEFIY